MIVYGQHLHWGAMMTTGKQKSIVGIFMHEQAAKAFCDAATEKWPEEFTPIKLNDFEDKHCEKIDRK